MKKVERAYSLLPDKRRATHAFFFGSRFGDRDGVEGRDGCVRTKTKTQA